MKHAWEMLKSGDRLQASEKAWGAMAHAIKVVANERSLPYTVHDDARVILHTVAAQCPYRDAIRNGFIAAELMHINFYNDIHENDWLDYQLGLVENGIKALDSEQARWAGAGRPPTIVTTPRYLERHRMG